MDILLLLSGYPGNVNSLKDTRMANTNNVDMDKFIRGHKYFNKLLKEHNTKVICSIWDKVGINQVKKYYKPVKCNSKNQRLFQETFSKSFGKFEDKRIIKRYEWYKNKKMRDDYFVPTSRYASQIFIRQDVCRQAISYLKNKKFQPEIIILSRFDIGSRGGILVRNPVEITKQIYSFFSRNEGKPAIVVPEFNQLNFGFPDMWFYLNKDSLFEMNNIYDVYINSVFDLKSEYMHYVIQGWPYSEWFNIENKNDKKQFSNIVLNKKENKKLMKYLDWEATNIHMFYKYFFSLRKTSYKIFFSKGINSHFAMLKFTNVIYYLKSIFNLILIILKKKLILLKSKFLIK